MRKVELDTVAKCGCGAVTLTARGRVLTMMLCTCTDCRKATGTGHASVVMMRRQDVAVTGEITRWSRRADSGATLARQFCTTCGTPICSTTDRAPDIVLLPAGLFENPNWFAPKQVIFARSHMDWDTLDPALPLHETYPD